jgi:predicted RNase H-like HicB family nuclease
MLEQVQTAFVLLSPCDFACTCSEIGWPARSPLIYDGVGFLFRGAGCRVFQRICTSSLLFRCRERTPKRRFGSLYRSNLSRPHFRCLKVNSAMFSCIAVPRMLFRYRFLICQSRKLSYICLSWVFVIYIVQGCIHLLMVTLQDGSNILFMNCRKLFFFAYFSSDSKVCAIMTLLIMIALWIYIHADQRAINYCRGTVQGRTVVNQRTSDECYMVCVCSLKICYDFLSTRYKTRETARETFNTAWEFCICKKVRLGGTLKPHLAAWCEAETQIF